MKPTTIIVEHIQGDKEEFKTTRSGGVHDSQMAINTDGSFVTVTDEWGNETIYPNIQLRHIKVFNND